MERKTIGGFIAALRKANGMTQKELAERLNVSDKTVSRWERDDGAPDLTLIPVLAEIFGVTCDELLRGERKSASAEPAPQSSAKGEKERRRILNASLAKFRNQTFIAMGVSVLGLIAALIGNLAFLRAVLGFLLGAIFFAASLVCQIVFLNQAFLSVADAEPEDQDVQHFKADAIRLTLRSVGLTVALVGFTFPLVLMDTYVGLAPDNLLLFGGLGALVFMLIYAVVCHYLNAHLLNKGIYTLDGKAKESYWQRHKLRRRCGAGLLIALVVTGIFHWSFNNLLSVDLLADTIRFTDLDSFVNFMETPMDDWYMPGSSISEEDSSTTYYDEYGNEISEEEALTETLEIDGKVVCTYRRRNQTVSQITYSGEGDGLPITVITNEGMRNGYARRSAVNGLFVVLYCGEVLATGLIYLKKRKTA